MYRLARLTVMRSYHRPLTLEEVAGPLSLPRQVQRAYAEFGASTFHDDLSRRRLDAAARLLLGASIPVSDVARRVGYRQSSHFARAFRRRYRVSPSAYRAQSSQAGRPEAREAITA